MAQLVEALRYQPEGGGFDFRLASSRFFIDLIFSGFKSGRHVPIV